MGSSYNPGGSSAAPSGPQWTFQASDNSAPSAGKFTTNNASSGTTTLIKISLTSKTGGAWDSTYNPFASNSLVMFSNSLGEIAYMILGAGGATNIGTYMNLSGSMLGKSFTWSGDVTCSFCNWILGASTSVTTISQLDVNQGIVTNLQP